MNKNPILLRIITEISTIGKYTIVGLIVYSMDMGGFVFLINSLDIPPVLANIVSKLIASIFGFLAHKKFTFKVENSNNKTLVFKSTILAVLNMYLSSFILYLLLIILNNPEVCKFIADISVFLLTYILNKYYIFKAHKFKSDASPKDRS